MWRCGDVEMKFDSIYLHVYIFSHLHIKIVSSKTTP